jgi:hypothetical protein
MIGTAIVIHADGTMEITQLSNAPTLDFLQEAVAGDIAIVPHFSTVGEIVKGGVVRCIAYCNEHGEDKKLPVNRIATDLWLVAQHRAGVAIDDVLLGPVVVLTGDDEFLENQ